MAKVFARLRLIAGALALAFVVATAMPVAAQQPSSVNPTAEAVKEQQLLQQLKTIEGRGSIPDVKSYVLEHRPAASGANTVPSRCNGSAASPFSAYWRYSRSTICGTGPCALRAAGRGERFFGLTCSSVSCTGCPPSPSSSSASPASTSPSAAV